MTAPPDISPTTVTAPLTGLTGSDVRGKLVLRLDHDEHQRRLACRLTAVTNLVTLDRLLNFPIDVVVPWPNLTARETALLRAVPEGVLEFTQDGIRRVLRPPAEAELAIVDHRGSWRTGLGKAGSFAPYCTRVLLTHKEPNDDQLWEAQYWGIGVWLGNLEHHQELVAPTPWKRNRVSGGSWEFLERAYAAWRAPQTVRDAR